MVPDLVDEDAGKAPDHYGMGAVPLGGALVREEFRICCSAELGDLATLVFRGRGY